MKKAILGKKLGMTQIFGENDVAIPVTVVQCGPMTVVDTRTVERNGYSAVVCAFEEIKEGKLNKPEAGLYKKAKAKPARYLREFRFEDADAYEVGKVIDCTIFGDGDMVDVSGVTKGRGFTGVIKRWNHHRLKMTHGTGPVHRSVGSTGANSNPSRRIKNLKMPGQYGHENVTIQNLKVVKVDKARGVLLIRGAVPGPKGGLVTVKETVK
ncbi:MAG: 50S ribosomal protein L3 [Clostridiales bacterium]|mgnify:CR=1 FL=1|uniref:50S ribosomal protein L3 n=1 Tax=Anaerocaecibacter muris TaxID=2941513 RepID=UPI00203EA949|nr:50S ribosomal protein L3 [Anaerocaecibacter muris]MDE6966234.1 50S ribosomal protein L3 [Clostridiales bacterium]